MQVHERRLKRNDDDYMGKNDGDGCVGQDKEKQADANGRHV